MLANSEICMEAPMGRKMKTNQSAVLYQLLGIEQEKMYWKKNFFISIVTIILKC